MLATLLVIEKLIELKIGSIVIIEKISCKIEQLILFLKKILIFALKYFSQALNL